jgi:osmotically-inducible protein OsmY
MSPFQHKEIPMSDQSLRQDVIDELQFEPSLDAANIGVAAKDGIVTLTGHVRSDIEKVKAEEVVSRVKGVARNRAGPTGALSK